MLLYGQLQEGLLYSLMESPAVSGVQNYKELSLAAKWEERKIIELKRKQQYLMKTERSQTSYQSKKRFSTSRNWYRNLGDKSEKEGTQKQLKMLYL